MADLKLIGTDGSRFYAWDLKPGNYVVGRNPDCDMYIPNRTVSRNHGRIEVDDDAERFLLVDLGSHNGTFVNGERVSDPRELKQGDRVMFGDAEFRLAEQSEMMEEEQKPSRITKPAARDPEKSVFLSINEALKPLPKKVTDLPDIFPTLSEMARMLIMHVTREEMLEQSLELVARVIPAQRLAVLYTSDDHEEIYPLATLLPQGKDPGQFTLSKTIINEILSNKNAILIGNPADDPRFAEQQSIILSEMKSAMAVPLFDEGNVLGILYVDTTNPMHQYTDDYLRLLATFGNIIASRIANFNLLHEREEKRLLESELSRASRIQKNMLVETCPTIPGLKLHPFQEQSRSVGGDLYDVTTLSDGRLLFLVADVSGKGTGAALLMSNLLAAFRILYPNPDFTLEQAVLQVSKQMFLYTAPEMFATLFIGTFDSNTFELSYINAGHNPPMIHRTNGKVEELSASGIVIGAFDFGAWDMQTTQLESGDTLVVFTDGVTEAENHQKDQYHEERLIKFLESHPGMDPEPMAKELLADIMKFTEGAPQSDDITMLIVRRD